jgi:hypothetical protein
MQSYEVSKAWTKVFFDDMHIIFGKTHVSGSSASCPGDISSDEASDEDVEEVPKPAYHYSLSCIAYFYP